MTSVLKLLLIAIVTALMQSQEECYQTCPGGEVPIGAFLTEDVGMCLQRPVEEGGYGDLVQEAMIKTYNNVFASTSTTASSIEGRILRGLQAARYGATLENSEGIYYCAVNNSLTMDVFTESFFWVVNADVLAMGASGNEELVANLTDTEHAMGGSQGYVVDDDLTGVTGGVFVRYIFNDTTVMRIECQPIPGPSDFRCSERPWYQSAMTCKDPAKLLCPSTFEGSEGMGTFQVYGNPAAKIAVGQDIPEWQMCQCLDNLECSDSGTSEPTSGVLPADRCLIDMLTMVAALSLALMALL